MSGDMWIIQFDHRSDGGPSEVGPFASKEAAERWSSSLLGPDWTASFSYLPLTPPWQRGRR